MTAFQNISQRGVFSYQRQLAPFVPTIPGSLTALERQAMEDSQGDLHGFFGAFYGRAYDDPASFGLPLAEDVCVNEGDGKDKKQAVTAQARKVRVKMAYAIDFLWLLGQHGALVGDDLRVGAEAHSAFFAQNPSVKRKMLKGMAGVGLTISESGTEAVIHTTRYPKMMPALKSLVEACQRFGDERLTKFFFARCDFRVMATDYQPDALDVLRAVVSPAEYGYAVALHQALAEMAYESSLSVGSPHDWQIRYQGPRAVKSTPFFEFEYDERQQYQLGMHVKCASTNRLVQFLAQQPTGLQDDFFRHAHNCGGDACGWCKTRSALGPSVLEYAGEKRTICWYMRRRFVTVDGEAVGLIKQYAQLHEALAAA